MMTFRKILGVGVGADFGSDFWIPSSLTLPQKQTRPTEGGWVSSSAPVNALLPGLPSLNSICCCSSFLPVNRIAQSCIRSGLSNCCRIRHESRALRDDLVRSATSPLSSSAPHYCGRFSNSKEKREQWAFHIRRAIEQSEHRTREGEPGERALGATTVAVIPLLEGEGLRVRRSDHVRLASGAKTDAKPPARKLEVRAGVGNTFGNVFRVTTYGESHGGGVGCIIDGCPPRLPLTEVDMQFELDRRRPGQSRITTPRKETDTCKILSGVADGLTLGTPIAVAVPNTDQRGGDYAEMSLAYRPSHADATYDFKYGVRAVQGGGRSSARETIGRVAAGAVAKKLLEQHTGTTVLAYVSRVHGVELPEGFVDHDTLTMEQIESNIVRCPNPEIAEKMIGAIDAVRVKGDSVGGVVTCIARNVPKGLGSPVFDKLEAELAKAVMSLPATKGFEIGSGFAGSLVTGSEHNDEFYIDDNGNVRTRTNRSGGIQGGISNGETIVMRIAFKPTSTITSKQKTVTRDKQETELRARGRHDPCVVPRAVPMVEAMVALVLADQVLQHYAQCQLFPGDPILQGAALRKRKPSPMEETAAFSDH